MANVLKTYRDLKSKHPDALLLFRNGDFYQLFNDDARAAAKELNLNLAYFRNDPTTAMCCFPHQDLDWCLPRLIRAGHRVAICDMPEPTTKLVRRGSDELTTTATNNRNNNPQTTENMKLNLSNTKSENQNVQNAQVNNIVVAASKPMTAEQYKEEPIQDAVAEEITDEQPAPKRKVTLKKKQPISEAQPAQVSTPIPTREGQGEGLLPHVQFSTYTTKRGDTAPQIIGFGGEDDPRWKAHKDAGHKWVSASYRRDLNGNKVYILLFGVRYMDVAKALCGAYNTADANAWHRAEDACMAIYEQAQRDGKARWEEKKAQWAAKKNEERRVKNEESRAAESAEKQVAAMLEKLMKGEDVPENILKHIDPEVLAKFTKAA